MHARCVAMKKMKRIEKEKKLEWNDVKGAKMRHQLLEGLMALSTG